MMVLRRPGSTVHNVSRQLSPDPESVHLHFKVGPSDSVEFFFVEPMIEKPGQFDIAAAKGVCTKVRFKRLDLRFLEIQDLPLVNTLISPSVIGVGGHSVSVGWLVGFAVSRTANHFRDAWLNWYRRIRLSSVSLSRA
eukprot:sb/3474502/